MKNSSMEFGCLMQKYTRRRSMICSCLPTDIQSASNYHSNMSFEVVTSTFPVWKKLKCKTLKYVHKQRKKIPEINLRCAGSICFAVRGTKKSRCIFYTDEPYKQQKSQHIHNSDCARTHWWRRLCYWGMKCVSITQIHTYITHKGSILRHSFQDVYCWFGRLRATQKYI